MSLIAHAKRIAAESDRIERATLALEDDRHPADDADTVRVREGLAGRQDARDVLPVIALLDALGPAGIRRVQGQAGLALVVEVPSGDWATRTELALRDLAPFSHVVVRTGASRTLDRPTEGNDKVAAKLSQGASVAGVSQAPDRYLPAALVQAADMVVRVGQPNNKVVSTVIRAVTGRRARRIPPAVAAGLSFDAITSAIRLGTSPASCIARLQATGRALSGGDALGENVPDLDTLHGYGAAMDWAKALVRDLDEWRAGRLDFSAISRTCTLTSEPGLGKSSLIRSLAKAAKVPLVSASVPEFFTASSGHLDGVLKAWENKLTQAAALAPAILFLDEIDSIPNRATMDNRGRDWWTPVVNGILAALDSTTSNITSRLIVIGATNHAELLDAALIRPGRLHPVIRIGRPDSAALAGILRQHLGIDLDGVDLSAVAHLGAGATGADVTAWVREARSLARTEGRRMVLADLVSQVAPSDDRTPEEMRICALHESSHAVIALLLDIGVITSVTIATGPGSAGRASARLHPRAFLTKRQLEHHAIVALAGRAMDTLGGTPNTGSGGSRGSDLDRATEAVLAIHAGYGLGESLAYRGGPTEAAGAMRVDFALRRIVEADLIRLHAEATQLVQANIATIEAMADRLIEARVLSGDQVAAIVAARGTPKARRRRGGHHAG